MQDYIKTGFKFHHHAYLIKFKFSYVLSCSFYTFTILFVELKHFEYEQNYI